MSEDQKKETTIGNIKHNAFVAIKRTTDQEVINEIKNITRARENNLVTENTTVPSVPSQNDEAKLEPP